MGEDIQARLRRLRREGQEGQEGQEGTRDEDGGGGGGGEAAPAAAAGLPTWVTRRLRRSSRPGSPAGVSPGPLPPVGAFGAGAFGARPAVNPLAPRSAGEPADLDVASGPHGEFAARLTEFHETARHGDWTLIEVDDCDPATLALLTGDAALEEVDLRSAVFLDTETTGLGGGAGVYVFMVGLGYFEGDRFHLWQGFLRDPSEERALLAETARIIRARDALVSFFGKSFDRHRLDDKMAIAGVPSPFVDRPHLDLYHPFQRLTRRCFADGRLATMESELCGLAREDDLPGAFAPEAWFDFLAERPHRLEGVFRHNRDDVLSLVTLAAYLGRATEERRVDGSLLAGPGGARARAIARALAERGEAEEALLWIERAVEREGAEGASTGDLWFARGELLGRLGQHDEALEAYARVHDGRAPVDLRVRAYIQTAKVLEHRLRRPGEALAACRAGAALLPRAFAGAPLRRAEADLAHRVARLARKSGQADA